MSRRLAAWVVVTGPYGRGFADPSLLGPGQADVDDLLDAVMVPRRLRREQRAAAGPQLPAGAARAGADSAAPAGSTRGLRGQAARDAIKAAQSARSAEKRRGRHRRAPRQPGVGSARIWPGGKPGTQ